MLSADSNARTRTDQMDFFICTGTAKFGRSTKVSKGCDDVDRYLEGRTDYLTVLRSAKSKHTRVVHSPFS